MRLKWRRPPPSGPHGGPAAPLHPTFRPIRVHEQQAKTQLPGRSGAGAAPGHALPVFPPRDLPARTGLQRLRRLRQAALRGTARPGPVRRPARAGGAHQLRQGGAHPHRDRHRHRHERAGGHRQPGHHRQERHARLRGQAVGRRQGRFAAHRPVRRGLLRRLHRGRQNHRGIAPRRPAARAGRALGERRQRRLRGGSHHPRGARHQRDPAPARRCAGVRRRLAPEGADRQVLRPHQPAHQDGRREVGRGRAGRPARPHGEDRRMGNREPGHRSLDPAQERRHRRAVRAVLRAAGPRLAAAAGLDAQPRRRQHRIHATALPAQPRAHGHVGPRPQGRREALREARVHHGRRRAAAAALPALCEGRGRFGRPAAQREPRAAAGKPRREDHPRRQHAPRARPAGGFGQGAGRQPAR